MFYVAVFVCLFSESLSCLFITISRNKKELAPQGSRFSLQEPSVKVPYVLNPRQYFLETFQWRFHSSPSGLYFFTLIIWNFSGGEVSFLMGPFISGRSPGWIAIKLRSDKDLSLQGPSVKDTSVLNPGQCFQKIFQWRLFIPPSGIYFFTLVRWDFSSGQVSFFMGPFIHGSIAMIKMWSINLHELITFTGEGCFYLWTNLVKILVNFLFDSRRICEVPKVGHLSASAF